jgi:hypothetical protein
MATAGGLPAFIARGSNPAETGSAHYGGEKLGQ